MQVVDPLSISLWAAVTRGTTVLAECGGQDERGDADAIAIGRGMIRNPRWAWDAAEILGGRADYVDQYAWCVGKG